MIAAIEAAASIVAVLGAVLLVGAAIGRLPRPVTLGVLALAEFVTVAAVLVDVALVASGFRTPGLATHISYLVSTPLIIPAGFALTYKKFDRWGLLIVGVATLIAAIMVVRQVQTLGIPFGYINV
ncbi:hypothetical protein [Gephyromycinifex aptenodytis]|uniref:hypothetical protein n=1 Tax=Gephyromycinifex aptenodytis TaxID=2716227 RepID=UPI001444A5BF|nr:hypothetical protein [Gephyromycinifex aptenodytis]